MIRPEDQRLLQPCLMPGERLLWAGRPKQGLVFRDGDFSNILFALVVATAVMLWQAADGSRDDSSIWWIAATAAIALYAVFQRYLSEAWRRAGLLYAVSDRRLILLRTRRRRSRSLDIACLPAPLLEEEDGFGTLRFDFEDERIDPLLRDSFGKWNPSGSDLPSFERIEHPQMVGNLIARESGRRRRELSNAVDPLFLR